jgi:hypothetical protein
MQTLMQGVTPGAQVAQSLRSWKKECGIAT